MTASQASDSAVSGSQSVTLSSLSSVTDLTAVFDASELPPALHQSRTTPCGFKLHDRRFAPYSPTPVTKRARLAWFWEHGVALTHTKTGTAHFPCRLCWDTKPQKLLLLDVTNQTSSIHRHLESKHRMTKNGVKQVAGVKRQALFDTVQRIDSAKRRSFDTGYFKACFIEWVVLDDITLRQSTSARLKRLFDACDPAAGSYFNDSHNTVRQWIVSSYHTMKPQIRERLKRARSKISLSFDAWTSSSHMPLLGICGHFIDENYALRTTLLSLPFISGQHTGENMAGLILSTIQDFDLEDKLGYFMMDNATVNDTTLTELSKTIPIDFREQRLRCLGHIINLACQAMLHGTDSDSFELDEAIADIATERAAGFEASLQIASEQQRLDAWRKKGAYGKGHNFVVHVNRSDQRRQLFKEKQKTDENIGQHLYELVVDGGVRWNSALAMITRLIQLKDAVTLYQHHMLQSGECEAEDVLSPDDWKELVDFKELLQPFTDVSMRTQGRAVTGSYGALWEWLYGMEYLMAVLERKKTELEHAGQSHFKTCVNLAWMKLDKYYGLGNQTSAYRAALLLHPGYKHQWFEERWSSTHRSWIVDMDDHIQRRFQLYEQAYRSANEARPNSSNSATSELSPLDQFNALKKRTQRTCHGPEGTFAI